MELRITRGERRNTLVMKGLNWTLILIVMFIIGAVIGSCSDSDSISGYDSYSDTYKSNSEYISNVSDIADAYGISEWEVDQKIKAVTEGR